MAIEFIRPKDLPAAAGVNPNDDLIVDNGASVGRATPREIVDAGRPVATEQQAVAGTDNDVAMTPLTTAQAIAADGAGIKSDAQTALQGAQTAQGLAEGARDSAQGYASAAGGSASAAAGSASGASSSASAALASAGNAASSGIAASQAASAAVTAQELAEDWAESPTPPDGPGTKSSKTWAGESEASAAQAAMFDGVWLDDVDSLLANETLSYGPGASGVAEGDFVRTRAESFSYLVSSQTTVANRISTAGGVNLLPLPKSGLYDVAAWGPLTVENFNKAIVDINIIEGLTIGRPSGVTIVASGVIEAADPIFVKIGGKPLRNSVIDLSNLLINAIPGGTLGPNVPVITIGARESIIYGPTVDCDFICSGIHHSGNFFSQIVNAGDVLYFSYDNDECYGMKFDGSMGNTRIYGGTSRQWTPNKPGQSLAKRVGRAFWFDDIDFDVHNINGGHAGVAIYIGPNVGQVQFIGIHPYQGGLDPATVDETIIENRSIRNFIYIKDAYLDNGVIQDYTNKLHIQDSFQFNNSKAVVNNPVHRIYCTPAKEGQLPSVFNSGNDGISVGFFPDPVTGVVFAGDDTAVNTYQSDQRSRDRNVLVANRNIHVTPYAEGTPYSQVIGRNHIFNEDFCGAANGEQHLTRIRVNTSENSWEIHDVARIAPSGIRVPSVDGESPGANGTLYLDTSSGTIRGRSSNDWWDIGSVRGSNANGKFVKHADGTLECWGVAVSVNNDIASGDFFRGITHVSFPAEFASPPVVTPVMNYPNDPGTLGQMVWPVSAFNVGTSSASLRCLGTMSAEVTMNYTAKGRWK